MKTGTNVIGFEVLKVTFQKIIFSGCMKPRSPLKFNVLYDVISQKMESYSGIISTPAVNPNGYTAITPLVFWLATCLTLQI
jgi:hypothetical protein